VMFNGSVAPMRGLVDLLRALPSSAGFTVAVTEYLERDISLVDVLPAGCTKGSTLAEWARRRGYEREEVMALGDNLNDMEMLEAAGLPVVMGNAVPALRARGWPMTASHDDAGVGRAIETYVLSAPSARPSS